MTLADALTLRADPARRIPAPLACASMADHVRAMLAFQRAGAVVFDYGNNLRAQAQEAGVADAFDYPGFVPAFIRPQFCEGRGPFRWAALSGDPADIQRTDEAILELFPDDAGLRRWIEMAQARVPFQGLPARICWLGYGERAQAGPRVQRARPHRRGRGADRDRARPPRRGSVASPNRETEAMADGSDAIADWPLLNALVNTAAGASVGLDPPRRRRRDRLLAARRHGRRRGRHGARRTEAGAGAHDGPGDGRLAARRRGLRPGDRGRRERGVRVPMLGE